jgi:hypothetical protein
MSLIRPFLPVLLLVPSLGGCSDSAAPNWLSDIMGGQKREGLYVDHALEDSYVVERAKLKRPLPKQDGAMRLQIAPSFGLYEYVFDFTPRPANCLMWWRDRQYDEAKAKQGCRIIAVRVWRSASETVDRPATIENRTFYVPEEDYRDVIQSFNNRLKGWRGRKWGMADGTWIGVEQVHKGKIGSMTANAGELAADNPLSQLSREVQRLAVIYGPVDFVPRSYGWHSIFDPDYPCWGGLSGVDSDGMGVGSDDACAAFLKEDRADAED